jgi:FkbM family methyltransferase
MNGNALSGPSGESLLVRAKSATRFGRAILTFIWTHPGNEGARIRALMRAARYQVRARVFHQRTLARLGEHSYVWVGLHRSAASKIVYGNPPDYLEMCVWRQVLQEGDLFIDVGANIGSYSILVSELGAEAIALEPADDTFALLKENVELNHYKIKMIQAAAGPTCGTVRFTTGRDTVNQIDPQGSAEAMMLTIDSVIEERMIAGMKIDVEGFEIEVLRGCERALAEHRINLIQLEWNRTSIRAVGTNRQPIVELLGKYGYDLYRPDGNGCLVPIGDFGYGPDVFAQPSGVS